MADRQASSNPFEGVTDYFSELNRMRRTGVHGREPGLEDWQRTHASAWVPAADIYARGEDLVIKLELAGVDPARVNLSFTHGVLTVSGSRQEEAAGEDVSFYVRERLSGEFRRAVTLPEGTSQSQIEAVFENGLVEVTVRGGANRQDTTRIELQTRAERPTTRPVT
jgi:HSP20 family protein